MTCPFCNDTGWTSKSTPINAKLTVFNCEPCIHCDRGKLIVRDSMEAAWKRLCSVIVGDSARSTRYEKDKEQNP